eukprot:5246759-Amphidinium_carterae.1
MNKARPSLDKGGGGGFGYSRGALVDLCCSIRAIAMRSKPIPNAHAFTFSGSNPALRTTSQEFKRTR